VRVLRSTQIDERTRRRLLWIGLLLLCFVPPLLSLPGKIVADTKTALWFATPRYLLNSLRVWQSSPYLGNEQHDGILFPMGLVVGLFHGAGLPTWLSERLWHGLLLFAAAAGTVLLVDVLYARRLTLAQPVAALAYAFNPYTLGYGLHGSAVFVPYALLPLLMVAWIRGLREPKGWFWPVVVALVFFGMGGGNGAPQVYALVPLLAYLAWAAFVERSVGLRAGMLFAAKAGALTIAVSLYWLVGLTTQGVANDIAFSEQPQVINITSSLSESLRLMGFWGFYGYDRFGAWYPSVQRYLTSPALVLGSYLLPMAAAVGAWRSRWRYRALFALLAVLGVIVMSGVYPIRHPSAFGHALLAAYRSIPGFSGLRTTYKFGSTLAMAVALLAGVGTAEAWRWMRQRNVWRRLAPLGLALVLLGLAADAYPMWSGNLYPGFRSVRAIPAYWQDAVRSLDRNPGGRVFFAPGGLFAYYRWGGPVGGIAEAFPQLPSIRRPALPIMERYGSDYLAAVEQPYQLGEHIPGATAAMLRRLGVHLVVLQNDLNFSRANTARPSEMQVLLAEPGLQRESSFGTAGENVPGSGALTNADRALAATERHLPPVQVLRVAEALPIVRAEAGPPLVLSGDAFGIPPAIAMGLVGKDQPILYSGALSPDELAALGPDQPVFVVTDSNRRRRWNFSAVRLDYSYTLTAADGGGRPVGYALFGGKLDTQTVTSFEGAADVTASSFGGATAAQPWLRPSAAFDGNPATAWTVSDFTPVGQWVRIAFDHPVTLSQLTIDPYVGRAGTRQLSSLALEFSDGSVVTRSVAPGPTSISFGQRTVTSIRFRITGVRRGVFAGPVGIRDITIPDVTVREALRLPTDLFDTAAKTPAGQALMSVAPLAYVFDRASSDGAVPDEELGVDRIFQVPSDRAFDLTGTVRLDPQVPDQELDRLLFGPTDVTASSSGRSGNNPASRASLVLDGDPATGWTAAGIKDQWIQIDFPAHKVGRFSLLASTDKRHSAISAIRVDLSDGASFVKAVPPSGKLTVTFRPRVLRSIKVTIEGGGIPRSLGGAARPPAGIAEIGIPGVSFPPPPNQFAPLPCYQGDGVTLDGQPLSVRLGGDPHRLLRGLPLRIEQCGDRPLRLSAGPHELRISGVLRPSVVAIGSPDLQGTTSGQGSSTSPPTPPALEVHQTVAGYRVQVKDATGPFYLVLGQNISPSWEASAAGRSLGPPTVLDGYSAGWRVDRTGSYTIDVAYAAQQRQDLAYVVSGLTLPVLLLVGFVSWRRRRRA